MVEDSPTQAERLRLLLEGEGYQVEVAGNGRKGLERVQAGRPDLVISDVVMPEMDGYELCRAVKSRERTKRISFVMLTDRRAPSDILRGLEAGADNFITKPFEDEYLLERVGRIFEHLQVKQKGHLDVEVNLRVAGRELTISVDKAQIIELLFATLEETSRLNSQLEESRRAVEEHARGLEAKVQERTRELQETNQTLRALIQASPLGIIVIQSDGIVKLWNPAAERIFGWVEGEVVGRPSPIVPEDKREEFQALVARGRRGEAIAGLDIQRQRKDGSLVDVRMYTAPLRDATGSIYADMTIYEDITERKRAEELERAKEAAEAANRAKSEFLSRMSHELRTPLNAILGFAQLLQLEAQAPEQRESVEHILKGGRHLLDLINEVLDISRIETGRLYLSPEPVPVGDLLREACDLIAPLATGRGIRVRLEAAAADRHVDADRQRLKQVLLNLLANAVKYNRDGGAVTAACEAAPGDRLRIRVSDTGPGIPPALLERLFMPFDRLGAEQSGVEGTGLGLALTKRLVEAMGGAVGVESALGQGSTFWVELPLAPSPVERLEGAPTEALAAAGAPGPAATVLYIEDNLSNLRLIECVLAHRPQVRLLPAMQGRLGLDLAREYRPALILLDLHLPDLPGHEVLRHLQGDARTRDIPVIVISADATPGQVERLKATGARAYLTKPVDVKQLLALLDEALAWSAQGRDGRPGGREVVPPPRLHGPGPGGPAPGGEDQA